MQGADCFYGAMRDRANLLWRVQRMWCQACQKIILGFEEQDALDIFVAHLRGKDHARKVRQLTEDQVWQRFQSIANCSIWLNHRSGEVWKDRSCLWQASTEEEMHSQKRPLDWSVWHRTVHAREASLQRPLTAFLHASDPGNGTVDTVDTARVADHSGEPAKALTSLRPHAYQLKTQLWEDMVEKDEIKRDLTASSFDWKTYLQGMPKLQNDLQVLSFCAELHRSARCRWTDLPQFHFVAYTEKWRILISQHRDRRCILIYEDLRGNFLCLEDAPLGECPRAPNPRESDVVQAFGGNSWHMRRLKKKFGATGSFKELVKKFLRIGGDLLDFACRHDLLEFSGVRLHWRLKSDQVEQDWRAFLRKEGQACGFGDAIFDEAVDCHMMHEDISRALDRFLQAGSAAAWSACCVQIRRCRQCTDHFQAALLAPSVQDAWRHVGDMLWSGNWTLPVDKIYFTHSWISRRFKEGSHLQSTVGQLLSGRTSVQQIPQIRVLHYHGKYHSVDNRRLWCFKEYQRQSGIPCWTRVTLHSLAGPGKLAGQRNFLLKFFDAFSSRNEGEFVQIRPIQPGSRLNGP
ncbi:unnamed protein product [Effrenium voratum]|nr:unnamed protein product [Effrenium voratum]